MLEDIIKEIDQFVADGSNLADEHNKMKANGLYLSTVDLFNRVEIGEKATNLAITGKSLYMEDKRALEVMKGERRIELKAELDENGKKKYTETTADAVINKEFEDEDKALGTLKTAYELLINIANTIPEYVNLVKLNMKALNPLQGIPGDGEF